MKKILFFIYLFNYSFFFAQSTVTIGNGTFAQGAPVSRFFRYHASEMIFLQSEINTQGPIETISFNKLSGTDNNVINDVSIYMRHTTATTLTSGTTATTGYTLVYSGTFTNNLSTGWLGVTLTSAFSYNNTENLQVLIIKGNQAPLLAAQFPRYAATSTSPDYRFRSYSDDSQPWSTTRSLGVSYDRPNVRFGFSCTPTSFTINTAACDNYTINGQTYTASGSYIQTLINDAGCDSLLTLNLTINNNSYTVNETVCNSYIFDGSTLTSSGVYTGTFTNAASCDSVVTLNLTIANDAVTVNETACDSYEFDGNTLTVSDTYIASFVNAFGCDSIVTLILTINTSDAVIVNETACDSYEFDGNTLTVSDTYIATFSNAAGCDSVVTLNLTIIAVENDVLVQNNVITAVESNATYIWIDCDANLPVNDETGQSFTVTIDGNYAVEITQNGCTVISDCNNITVVSVSNTPNNMLNIYPNPTLDKINIESASNITIRIYNTFGQLVLSDIIVKEKHTLSLEKFENGLYFVEVNEGNVVTRIKLIKY